MKKRIFSFLLAFIMLGTFSIAIATKPAEPEPHASLYLDAYAIGVKAKGNGLMAVTYIVYGTDIMDCLGAQKIVVEEWDGEDWFPTATYPVEKNPEFYAADVSEHAGTVYFYGLHGVQYRATLTAYAELNGGSDTGIIISSPETCK